MITPKLDQVALWGGLDVLMEKLPEMFDGSKAKTHVALLDGGASTSSRYYLAAEGHFNTWDNEGFTNPPVGSDGHGGQCALHIAKQFPEDSQIVNVQVKPTTVKTASHFDVVVAVARFSREADIGTNSYPSTSSAGFGYVEDDMEDSLLFCATGVGKSEFGSTAWYYPAALEWDMDGMLARPYYMAVGGITEAFIPCSPWSKTKVSVAAFAKAASYAPPQVAGLAAALKAFDNSLTRDDLRDLITRGAVQFPEVENYSIYGVIHPLKTFSLLVPSLTTPTVVTPDFEIKSTTGETTMLTLKDTNGNALANVTAIGNFASTWGDHNVRPESAFDNNPETGTLALNDTVTFNFSGQQDATVRGLHFVNSPWYENWNAEKAFVTIGDVTFEVDLDNAAGAETTWPQEFNLANLKSIKLDSVTSDSTSHKRLAIAEIQLIVDVLPAPEEPIDPPEEPTPDPLPTRKVRKVVTQIEWDDNTIEQVEWNR